MARRARARRYYRNPPSSKSSGMSDGAKIALTVGGVAALAGIGYLIYKSTSSSSASNTLTSGTQSTTLGPGGSSTPLPTATSSNDFEAGVGTDAPLVPTANG
jgi:hypothetical protein